MEFRILNKTGLQHETDKVKTLDSEAESFISDELDGLSDDILDLETQIDEFAAGLEWKDSVATYADLATTYPNPEDGWTVNVLDTDYTYRYDGTEWIPISANAIPDATTQNKGLMTTVQAKKLNDLVNYTLPKASPTSLGGIRPDGTTLEVDEETGQAIAHGSTRRVEDLTNVRINGLLGGQVLSYNAGMNMWENTARGGVDVELDDVSGASVSASSAHRYAVLTWTDPNDVVISGATLAEWDGTKVVRKANSAPTSIEDGTVIVDSKIRNQYSTIGYIDNNLSFGVVYYYKFFPYTKKNKYTSGTVVSVSLQEESVEIPTVVGTYTYNGNSQTVVLSSNYGFTLSGTYIATNAGTYTAVATLSSGYVWSDSTYEPKNIVWSIAKANSNIVATPSTVYLHATRLTETVTLSNLLDRTVISAISNDTSIATVSLDSQNNTITVSHVNQTGGETSITVTTSDVQNYNASTISIPVSAQFVSTTLNDNSWDIINAAAIDGTASTLWAVGDRKVIELDPNVEFGGITLGNYNRVCAFILGFNHNATFEGGYDIHFQIGFDSLDVDFAHKIGYCNASVYNATRSVFDRGDTYFNPIRRRLPYDNPNHNIFFVNKFGWFGTNIRGYTLKKFKQTLPVSLINNLKVMKKYTDNTPISTSVSTITKTYDPIFLPSRYEISGLTNYRNYYEDRYQSEYTYYLNGNHLNVVRYNVANQLLSYYLRTPPSQQSSPGSGELLYKYSDSSVTTASSTACYSITPCFAIGRHKDSQPTWTEGSDAEIISMLNAHYNDEINIYDYWQIGDERVIHLNGNGINEDVTFVLVNIGGKRLFVSGSTTECSFIVRVKTPLSVLKPMLEEGVNVQYAWANCSLRTWLNNDFRNSFPSTIVSIFKEHYNAQSGSVKQDMNSLFTNDYFALETPMERNGICEVDDYADGHNDIFEYNIDSTHRVGYWTREKVYSSDYSVYSFYPDANGTVGQTTPMQIAPFGVI